VARIPANWSRSSRRAAAAADRGLGKPLLPADAGPPPARRRSAGDIASSFKRISPAVADQVIK
jgi:hypothetical protein